MDKKTKEEYINLIDKIEIEDEVKTPFIDFIRSYDGTNVPDFKVLVITVILLLAKYGELNIKAQGFDAIKDNDEDYQAQFDALKKEYESLKSGKDVRKPHTAGTDN